MWRRSHCSGVRSRAELRTMIPGVVHHDVEAAFVSDRLGDGIADLVGVGDVHVKGPGHAARLFDEGEGLGGILSPLGKVGDSNVGARPGQPRGYGASNAPRTAGYNGYLSAQVYG